VPYPLDLFFIGLPQKKPARLFVIITNACQLINNQADVGRNLHPEMP
jgi:hypothetical protein